MKGEIRLVALDAATGKLEWTQQLAVLETTLGTEQLRRAAACARRMRMACWFARQRPAHHRASI